MIILSGLFAAGWRVFVGAGGWKMENLEKRGCSRKAEEESKSGHPRRRMSHLCRTKTAKVGHPNRLGELRLGHPPLVTYYELKPSKKRNGLIDGFTLNIPAK